MCCRDSTGEDDGWDSAEEDGWGRPGTAVLSPTAKEMRIVRSSGKANRAYLCLVVDGVYNQVSASLTGSMFFSGGSSDKAEKCP